ncbi:hypothetical protein CRG98_050439 [Punica granatum]|uniref:Uncharacterized protein n=1 Tax=Punica granatum TaxID=22663 RepID=A0A2I0GCA2_PUNGR|nr:hypothetical protein CRG98_050439 [Punica granatum]
MTPLVPHTSCGLGISKGSGKVIYSNTIPDRHSNTAQPFSTDSSSNTVGKPSTSSIKTAYITEGRRKMGKFPCELQMQPPYGTLLGRVQSRRACRTDDRAAKASSGKSRYAHVWLTGVLGGLTFRPPITGPTCTVKAKFFTSSSGDPKLKTCASQ